MRYSSELVVAAAFVAERDIQIAVGPEMQIAAVVVGGFVDLVDQDQLRVRERLVRIRR